jgi:Zn-dependent protease
MLGRLTVNPLKHIDPIGTVIVPGLAILTSGIMFGWAKPVPVNTRNLHNPRRDMALVAAAGPIANIMMALFWVIIIKVILSTASDPEKLTGIARGFFDMAFIGVYFNLILCFFNLIPLPTLDGSRILVMLLPPSLARLWDQLEPYGMYIIIGIILLSVNGIINISPFFDFIRELTIKLIS